MNERRDRAGTAGHNGGAGQVAVTSGGANLAIADHGGVVRLHGTIPGGGVSGGIGTRLSDGSRGKNPVDASGDTRGRETESSQQVLGSDRGVRVGRPGAVVNIQVPVVEQRREGVTLGIRSRVTDPHVIGHRVLPELCEMSLAVPYPTD